jgi:hypothetical protein
MLSQLAHILTAWIIAHPQPVLLTLVWVGGSGINGRLAGLTRRDAPGTLKWPIIAGSVLRFVADSINPPAPGEADERVLGRTTIAPPGTIAPRRFDPNARLPLDRDSQQGSSPLGVLLLILVILTLAAACANAFEGCR